MDCSAFDAPINDNHYQIHDIDDTFEEYADNMMYCTVPLETDAVDGGTKCECSKNPPPAKRSLGKLSMSWYKILYTTTMIHSLQINYVLV